MTLATSPPPEPRSITSARFGMELPERKDRVLVEKISEAFLLLDRDAANLTIDNTFTGNVTVQGQFNAGSVTTVDITATRSINVVGNVSVGAGLGVSGNVTFMGSLNMAGNGDILGARNLAVSGNTSVGGQVEASTDIRAGWSLWAHFDVNVGRNLNFTAGGARLFWNGGGVQSSHYLMSGGNLFLHGNGGIWIGWDGGSITHSHQVRAPSVYSDGRIVTGGWDVGWPNNFGGNAIFAGAVVQLQGRLVTNNWDSGWGNSLGGDTRMAGRLVTNNWDVGLANNMGGNLTVQHDVSADNFLVRHNNTRLLFPGGAAVFSDAVNGGSGNDLFLTTSVVVFWDLRAGHHISAVQVLQTSRADGKLERAAFSDADALTRVLDPRLSVQTWVPSTESGVPSTVNTGTAESALQDPSRTVGFTAEEMAQVVPEVVYNDAAGPAAIAYENLTAILWGALRELEHRVAALESPGGTPA